MSTCVRCVVLQWCVMSGEGPAAVCVQVGDVNIEEPPAPLLDEGEGAGEESSSEEEEDDGSVHGFMGWGSDSEEDEEARKAAQVWYIFRGGTV